MVLCKKSKKSAKNLSPLPSTKEKHVHCMFPSHPLKFHFQNCTFGFMFVRLCPLHSATVCVIHSSIDSLCELCSHSRGFQSIDPLTLAVSSDFRINWKVCEIDISDNAYHVVSCVTFRVLLSCLLTAILLSPPPPH